MDIHAYQALIEDTMTYLKRGVPESITPPPKREKIPPPQPPSPPPKKVEKPPVKPEPPSPPPKEKKVAPSTFQLEPPSLPPQEPTETLRKLLVSIDPELFLHDTPPSDALAKRIKEAWKEKRDTPTIPILFQGRSHRPFVMNIAKAIDLTFATCRIIEVEPGKKWDLFLESPNLKFILAPDHLIFGTKELLPFYKEHPQEKKRYLGNIPLLLLPDLSLYYKDPYLKRSLWNVITQNLQPLF